MYLSLGRVVALAGGETSVLEQETVPGVRGNCEQTPLGVTGKAIPGAETIETASNLVSELKPIRVESSLQQL